MAMLAASAFGDRLPTEVEREDADRLRRIMEKTRIGKSGYRFVVHRNDDTANRAEVHLDAALGETLLSLLDIIAKGQAVMVTPVESRLSTKQAASILAVSRPFLIKLLESGEIPFEKVGMHRRVKAADLFDYKRRQDAMRGKALAEMLKADGL